MSADDRVYPHISRQSRGAYAFLAYTGAHQVENIYKDGLYLLGQYQRQIQSSGL